MIKKIAVLIVLTLVLFILWLVGLETIYAYILKFGVSILLAPFSEIQTRLGTDMAHPYFCILNGKEGYCMEMELFSLSIIVMLSWYIFLNIFHSGKSVLLISIKHILIFYVLQLLTISTLAWYELSPVFEFLNEALRHSFIIIALVFIIWDNYMHNVFSFKKK